MDRKQLDEIKARCAAATPEDDDTDIMPHMLITEAQWNLYSHADEDIPALVAEVERLRARLDRLQHEQSELDVIDWFAGNDD